MSGAICGKRIRKNSIRSKERRKEEKSFCVRSEKQKFLRYSKKMEGVLLN
jgi:hypothetical protein